MCSNYRPFVYLQLNNFNLIAINWANLIKWRLIQHSIWTGDCLNVHHLRRRYEIAIRSPLRGGRRQPKNHQSVELNTEQRWRDEQKEQKKIIIIVIKKKKEKKRKKKKKKKKLPGAADETRPILAVQLGVATLMKRRFNPLLCLWPLLSCSVFLCFFKRPERVQQCPRSEWMTKTKEPKEGQREKRDANIRRLLTHKHTHTKK